MKKVLEKAVEQIRQYWSKYNRKYAFIGVSGGKDSTVCLKLMADALGTENVFALRMPHWDTESFKMPDKDVMDWVGIPFNHRIVVPIKNACEAILECIPEYSPDAGHAATGWSSTRRISTRSSWGTAPSGATPWATSPRSMTSTSPRSSN